MAKFLSVVVDSRERIFSAENIIMVAQASSTTTAITYCTGSASTDVLTFTHAADASFTVEKAFKDAILEAHCSTAGHNKKAFAVKLPLAITLAAIA